MKFIQCLSDSAVRACHSAQSKLRASGAGANGSIACYADMAVNMNGFTDIMNGGFFICTLALYFARVGRPL